MTSLLVALLFWPTPSAQANTRTRLNQDLWACSENLLRRAPDDLKFLARKFSRYTVTDVGDFRATYFTHENEEADAISFTLPDLSLPKKFYKTASLEDGYHLYDVGFKNLERDAKAVNKFTARRLIDWAEQTVKIDNSMHRMSTLLYLHRMRWSFHSEVLQGYKGHRSKAKYLEPVDYDQMIEANQQDNSDVLGLTRGAIDASGDLTDIPRKLLMSLQISYDQPMDFLFPSLDGMLEASGQSRLSPRRLPFIFRIAPDKRDEITEWFWASYGHLKTCEIARLIKKADVPEHIEARFFLMTLRRVLARECQFIVANQDSAVFRLFEQYGFNFRRLRSLPTGTAAKEHLVYLDVSTREFWESYGSLTKITGFVSSF